jgi:thymidylate kinase
MEQKGNAYHRKVRSGFLKLAKGNRKFTIIDATKPAESVQRKIVRILTN